LGESGKALEKLNNAVLVETGRHGVICVEKDMFEMHSHEAEENISGDQVHSKHSIEKGCGLLPFFFE
jgi:hypothetical protein